VHLSQHKHLRYTLRHVRDCEEQSQSQQPRALGHSQHHTLSAAARPGMAAVQQPAIPHRTLFGTAGQKGRQLPTWSSLRPANAAHTLRSVIRAEARCLSSLFCITLECVCACVHAVCAAAHSQRAKRPLCRRRCLRLRKGRCLLPPSLASTERSAQPEQPDERTPASLQQAPPTCRH
jgi:hypothetical protein